MASRQCCRRSISSIPLWHGQFLSRRKAKATIRPRVLPSCACDYHVQPRLELALASVLKTRLYSATERSIVLLTSCQTRQIHFTEAKNAYFLHASPALLYVYWSLILSNFLTLRQRIKSLRFQRWQNRYRKAPSSNGLNAGLRKYP